MQSQRIINEEICDPNSKNVTLDYIRCILLKYSWGREREAVENSKIKWADRANFVWQKAEQRKPWPRKL